MAKRKAEDTTAARDFVMARMAACRSALALAAASLDESLDHFVDPSEDTRGKKRVELMEVVDHQLGEAARAIQLAMEGVVEVDFAEGEPEDEEDGDEDDDDDEDEEDDDEDDE